jgi:hypothetical protein
MWTAIQGYEVLPFELEGGAHDRALRSRPRLSIAGRAHDPGVSEEGSVELDRLFGLIVERQEWGDLLHVVSLLF